MTVRSLRVLCATLAAAALLGSCAEAPTAPPATRSDLLGISLGGPHYISCPTYTSQSTSGVIGPLGGVLTLGGQVVNIPAGAVTDLTTFVLTVPASQYMKIDVTAVGIDHLVFGTPISVTIDYSRCSTTVTAGKSLEVWYVSSLLNLPLQNMGGTDDPVARNITFSTGHLSGYIIAD
jgi:hypothetical protein